MLIAHVVHRFDIGGMENGLVNLINRMPRDRYRHAIVSLTDSTDFRARVERDDVEHYSLHKKPGHDLGLYPRLWRLFRRLKPSIVHTRNLASLEAVVPAALAGVPFRIHGEHGRDLQDIDGTKKRYRWLRRALSPVVHRFIALSKDLESYLVREVGVRASKVVRITNGVDTDRFRSSKRERGALIVIGCVTRMQEVKDPLKLVRAFVKLQTKRRADNLRLVMIGDGPLLPRVSELVRESGVEEFVSLKGRQDDVDEQLRAFDVFSQSSRVEGISNTILEAMASGLPVVATRVGGNEELIDDEVTGFLVSPRSDDELASALGRYVDDIELMGEHGRAGRRRAESEFSIDRMVARYTAVYDEVASGSSRRVPRGTSTSCAG